MRDQYFALNRLLRDHPEIVSTKYDLPEPYYKDLDKVKVIILGADPTHIVDGEPTRMKKVFGLENGEKSPYWRGIGANLDQIGLTLDDVYVQNVCRNYFKSETSKNEEWLPITMNYWIPVLRSELRTLFPNEIPVLLTSQYVLWATQKNPLIRIKAINIYRKCIAIPEEESHFSRRMLAFYRHWYYSLRKRDPASKLPDWTEYATFVRSQIK